MRPVAFAVGLGILVAVLERPASARTSPAVDDEAERGAAAPDDTSAIDLEEALGPRSNLRTRAEQVSFDARQRTLELAGDVRVDAPPFHLRSPRIKLARTRYGIAVIGQGSLAFCPCLGTPLTVDFEEALVAPPGDLILTKPTLRLYGVPVLPLPYFWLRTFERAGALPPEIAYRGRDGVFVGGGLHVPWRAPATSSGGAAAEPGAVDVRGGAYLVGGFVADVRLRTAASTTKVRYDRLPGGAGLTPGAAGPDDGLLLDARGSSASGELGVAWDVDAVRGARGVASTTELDAAARPFDRAAVEAVVRGGPLAVGSSIRSVTRRGGGLGEVDAVGPTATVRASGAAASGITYDATVEAGSLRLAVANGGLAGSGDDALSFARAKLGGRAATVLGPLEASLALRGAADVAARARTSGGDRAASARARLAAPLLRRFAGPPGSNDPWVHVVEPFVEAAVIHAEGGGLLGAGPARGGAGVVGTAPVASAGLVTTLGRWGSREALELGVAGGGVAGARDVASGVRPLARARAALGASWLGGSAEVARVFFSEGAGDAPGRPSGLAAVGRVRLGTRSGLRLVANVAARDGLDPVLARALVDPALEPAAGFLALSGSTAGAGLVVPWSRWLTTHVGADGDLTQQELVAARAGVELRDRCGCLTFRVTAARRIGREGVDAWLALDFAGDP